MAYQKAQRVARRQAEAMVVEWDSIADLRQKQILSGRDLTYNHVLLPAILDRFAATHPTDRVLDVGCGTGLTSLRLATLVAEVVAIDPSERSIALARAAWLSLAPELTNLKFLRASVEEYALSGSPQFDQVVANMVLMDMADLTGGLEAVARLLKPGGVFTATITHPWFWPLYWGYDREPWFRYSEEIFIEAPLNITLEQTSFRTTHVHRPLQHYLSSLESVGLDLDQVCELQPAGDLLAEFPKPWSYPRYLLIRTRKQSSGPKGTQLRSADQDARAIEALE